MKVTAMWPAVLRGPIVHLEFPTQEAVCGAMVRVQEFYESPIPGIRGSVFSFPEYAEANKAANGGKYLYDWNGFNIPGHVVREFFDRFAPLSADERAIREHAIPPTGEFYLIATHAEDDDADTYAHEICHAFFYLSQNYHNAMVKLVEKFRAENPDTANYFHKWLLDRGYHESVLIDEAQAYLATTPRDWWIEPEQGVPPETATALWDCGHLFRALVRP